MMQHIWSVFKLFMEQNEDFFPISSLNSAELHFPKKYLFRVKWNNVFKH